MSSCLNDSLSSYEMRNLRKINCCHFQVHFQVHFQRKVDTSIWRHTRIKYTSLARLSNWVEEVSTKKSDEFLEGTSTCDPLINIREGFSFQDCLLDKLHPKMQIGLTDVILFRISNRPRKVLLICLSSTRCCQLLSGCAINHSITRDTLSVQRRAQKSILINELSK